MFLPLLSSHVEFKYFFDLLVLNDIRSKRAGKRTPCKMVSVHRGRPSVWSDP